MSETQSEVSNESVMGPTFTADPPSAEDNALQAIWAKHNGPEAEMRDPAMPDSFARAEAGGDRFQAAAQWMNLPLETRQMEARAAREFEDRKKQGESLGMKVESAADHKAIPDMLAGDKQQAFDKDTQASLDTFKTVVPFAKDHREASQFLNGWAEQIARDPDKGWSELLKAQGMGHLLREGPQAPQAQPANDSGVAAWAAKRGVSVEDQRAMGEIVSEPTWREIAGESLESTLDRAHKALQRSRARNGANNASRRVNDDLDRTLRGIAADIARP